MGLIGGALAISFLLSLGTFLWLVSVAFKRSVAWGSMVFLLSPFSAIVFAMTNWYHARKPFIVYLVSTIILCVLLIHIYIEVGLSNLQGIAKRIQQNEITLTQSSELLSKAYRGEALFKSDLIPELPAGDDNSIPLAQNASVLAANRSALELDTSKTEIKTETPALDTAAAGAADAEAADKVKNQESDENTGTKGDKQQAENEKQENKEDKEQNIPLQKLVKPDPLKLPRVESEGPKTTKVSVARAKNFIGRYFIIQTKSGAERRGILRKVTNRNLIFQRNVFQGSFEFEVRKNTIKSLRMLDKPESE